MLGKVSIYREGGARKSGQNGVAKTGANIGSSSRRGKQEFSRIGFKKKPKGQDLGAS